MPCVMIRKCAMVTALREAFPEDLQGLYDASEMGIDTKLPEKEIIQMCIRDRLHTYNINIRN